MLSNVYGILFTANGRAATSSRVLLHFSVGRWHANLLSPVFQWFTIRTGENYGPLFDAVAPGELCSLLY